jgi:release factor glutamine methyltransferase
MKLIDRITEFRQRLSEIELSGIGSTNICSEKMRWEQMVMEILDLKFSEIYKLLQQELLPQQKQAFELAEWGLRLGIPLSRVFGRRFFYDSTFLISPFVLDPRPETEALVEYVISLKPKSILDLGTGSGCILLSILKEIESRGVGVDISPYAIQNARENAIQLGLLPAEPSSEVFSSNRTSQVEFILGDFAKTYGKFENIVSNPPYILQPNLSNCSENSVDKSALTDPPLALFETNNSLTIYDASRPSCYQQIIASNNLLTGGYIVFEIPEHALKNTVQSAKTYGLKHELSRRIGKDLYMCVLKKCD